MRRKKHIISPEFRCQSKTKAGKSCSTPTLKGKPFCLGHDPRRQAMHRALKRAEAGTCDPSVIPEEPMRELQEWFATVSEQCSQSTTSPEQEAMIEVVVGQHFERAKALFFQLRIRLRDREAEKWRQGREV